MAIFFSLAIINIRNLNIGLLIPSTAEICVEFKKIA
jgi:hypothetical protein